MLAKRTLIALLLVLGLLLAFAPWVAVTAEAQTTDPRVADLVRAGKPRVGLFLPQYGKGPDGLKTTVFVETARAFAARIGIPLVIVEHATPPEAIACLKAGSCDLLFLQFDARASGGRRFLESNLPTGLHLNGARGFLDSEGRRCRSARGSDCSRTQSRLNYRARAPNETT